MMVDAWLRLRRQAVWLNVPSVKLSEFQAMLANQLVNPPKIGRPSLGATPPAQKRVYRRKVPAAKLRLDNIGHLQEISAKRGRCKQKGCTGYTQIKCSKCRSLLCLTK